MKRPAVNVFFFTNALKVLRFLSENPEKEFTGSEIQDATALSRAGVYFALRDLERQKLVLKRKKGRGKLLLYELNNSNPAVKQFKVLVTVISLEKLTEGLKPSVRRAVLFGSAARGEDTSSSDIDLFLLSKDPAAAGKTIDSFKSGKTIKPVIKTQVEYSKMKDKEETFLGEIDRGIVLWSDDIEHTI